MKRIAFVAALAFAACGAPPARPVPVAETPQPVAPPPTVVTTPPVQQPPAPPPLRLPRPFLPTGYTAKLALDPDKPTFEGQIQIDGQIAAPTREIWLHAYHMQFHRVVAIKDGRSVTLSVAPQGEEVVQLRSDAPLEPGAWQVAIDYTGEVDPATTLGAFKEVSGGAAYIFSQFESIGARRAFPCLDEPDNKVPWKLTIDAPKGDVAVANTPVAHDAPRADGGHSFEFEVTKPLPSYLVAFGVGPFDIVPGGKTKSGVPVRVIAPHGRAAEAAYAAANTAKILDLLEAWFGIPYAFGKLDVMALPTTSGFGAMENAGLVTFEEGLVLLDPKTPSWERRAAYISVAAHEFAHQWFGDLVTTAWWNDIWLNEGFADWMETKITAEFDPKWHFELEEVQMRHSAEQSDSLVTARQIRQPIENENDILNSFDDITYSKGASVLRMFETYVGPDAFQRGVREYLTAKQFGNATSADFIAAMSKASGKDLAPAFATFLDQAGLPELSFAVDCGGGAVKLTLTQRRYVGNGSPVGAETKPWLLPVCVAYSGGGKRETQCALIDQSSQALELKAKQCPRWILPNVGGRGYFISDLTAPQVTALRDEAWSQLTEAERLVVAEDAAHQALDPHNGISLPLALAASFVPKLLAQNDRYAIGDVGRFIGNIDQFVPGEQRPKFEAWLRQMFSAGAGKLGALPKSGDSYDAEASRTAFWSHAGYGGRDPELAKQAIELAARWRDLPEAVRGTLLSIAVDASPEVQAKVRADASVEHDTVRQGAALAALASVRDPARLGDALGAMLDPQIDFRHSMWMLVQGPNLPETVPAKQSFFKAHQAELMKRLPPIDDTGVSVYAFSVPFAQDCNAARRDEMVDFMKKSFSSIPGAPRALVQLAEGLDRCIATRRVLEPEVGAWLGGVKIPKVAPKSASSKSASK